MLSAFAPMASADAVDMKRQFVRGNASFTAESYETIWITPIYDNPMIAGVAKDKYPTKFFSFSAPDNGCLMEYAYDKSVFINNDSLAVYRYLAYDRGNFEMFLDFVDDDNVLAYGDETVAVYVDPDKGSAHAMLDLDSEFGSTAKLEIIIDHKSGMLLPGQLKDLIIAEVERVQGELSVQNLDHYWSEGMINTITIGADDDPFEAVITVDGYNVTATDTHAVVTKEPDGSGAKTISVAIARTSRAHSEMSAREGKLSDGKPYLKYNAEYTGYATFTLTEKGNDGRPVYFTVAIDCRSDEFDAELEALFGRVQLRSLR